MNTRLSLIARLPNPRDEAAWSEFIRLYESVILRVLRKYGLQEADARDACQQVLAAVARDVSDWKPDDKPASFRRWLYQIARNRALKLLLRQRGRILAEGGTEAVRRLEGHAADDATLSAEFEREYRQHILLLAGQQIRGEFQPATWMAFWLTCIDGRPVAEVAGELKTTVGNVYVARSRIIARLREKVAELEGAS